MLFEDTYLSIDKVSEGLFKDRGSKFIALAIPVKTETEVKKQISEIRKQYHDACHHSYAYRLGYDKSAFRHSDDGEPSGTAGKPIFGQILSKDLTNILIVVIRYFGGTLLGVSGLINAYRSAASDALEKAVITEKTINDLYEITFEYPAMNVIMKIIKDNSAVIIKNNSEITCSIQFKIRKKASNKVYDQFQRIDNTKLVYICTE